MKWWKLILILALMVAAVLVTLSMTKPDRTAHYDAVKKAVLEVVSKELNENPTLQAYATIGTMKALEATDELLTQGLILHDNTYYNLGLLIYEGHPIPVSVGILGQIHLTMNHQDLQSLIRRPDVQENIGLKDLNTILDRIRPN